MKQVKYTKFSVMFCEDMDIMIIDENGKFAFSIVDGILTDSDIKNLISGDEYKATIALDFYITYLENKASKIKNFIKGLKL